MLDSLLHSLAAAALFSLLGLLAFGIVFWIMVTVAPFSVRKEIEEDQNTALGILMGSVIIGVSLIIAAAVHG